MSSGFLVVDKPAGITSHGVVSVLRAMFGIKRIGHTGTLDPFATGVLPMAIGHATRLIQFLDEGVKVYDARIKLGAATDTGDLTGTVTETADVPQLDAATVTAALAGFIGERMQTPPAYSAVKIQGKALYKYAREGKPVRAAPRPIRIDSIVLDGIDGDTMDIRVQCGRGTYVRVLAEEIAESVGTKGHLVDLRRTQSGPFELSQSIDFESLSELAAGRPDWRPVLRPRRGEERVPWVDREQIVAALNPRLRQPMDVLSHLPLRELSPADRRLLQLKGVVVTVPEDVAEGGFWRVSADGKFLGIMKRAGDIGKVARMLPSG